MPNNNKSKNNPFKKEVKKPSKEVNIEKPQEKIEFKKNQEKYEPIKTPWYKKTWAIIAGAGVLISILINIPKFTDLFSSPHKKYEQETFKDGYLNPPPIKDSNHYSISEYAPDFNKYQIPPAPNTTPIPQIKGIYIKNFSKRPFVFVFISGFLFTCLREDFYKGIDIFNPVFDSCNSTHLILGVRNDRLYVSVEFKDLQNEQTIGYLEYNHWKLYKPNLFDYNNDDNRLEVIDRQHNIVFSIKYEENVNAVEISGYFIGTSSIIVMPNNPKKSKSVNPFCVSKAKPNWKQIALEEIVNIKSIF